MKWWQRWRMERAMRAYFKADALYDKARAFLPETQRSGSRALSDLLDAVETKRQRVLRHLGDK